MEKNGRVEEGKTPSVHSGAPSEVTDEHGEAVLVAELGKRASFELEKDDDDGA